MTKKDIKCYRINYKKAYWYKFAESEANQLFPRLPLGTIDAIHALCDEVERLRNWKKS